MARPKSNPGTVPASGTASPEAIVGAGLSAAAGGIRTTAAALASALNAQADVLDQLAGLYNVAEAPATAATPAGGAGGTRPGPTPGAPAHDEKQMREDMLEYIKLSDNKREVVDAIIAKHAGRAMPLKEVPPSLFPAIHADVLMGLHAIKNAPAAPMGADDL